MADDKFHQRFGLRVICQAIKYKVNIFVMFVNIIVKIGKW